MPRVRINRASFPHLIFAFGRPQAGRERVAPEASRRGQAEQWKLDRDPPKTALPLHAKDTGAVFYTVCEAATLLRVGGVLKVVGLPFASSGARVVYARCELLSWTHAQSRTNRWLSPP